jgi:hypothetical protein
MSVIPPPALIDVRAVNDEAHPAAFRNISVGPVIPALVGKDGGVLAIRHPDIPKYQK